MTELAYLDGPDAAYVRRFRARIQARPPGAVVLDRTYFYAVGGGQPADRGILRAPSGRSVDVVDVSKSGTAVLHRTRGSPEALADFAVGTEVEGVLDFERRYRHMRLHTGQHFLSARIFARAGVRTQKARLGGRGGILDLERAIPADLLPELAQDAAEILAHPRPVRIRRVPRAEWNLHPSARSALVVLAPHVDPVRVIEIEEIDACPCGGTHVRSTAEIGRIAIQEPVALVGGGCRLAFTLSEEVATPSA
ncbi:MAG: alanyl-tRNA editing protein [Thermoplasmata archaeon]